MKQLWMALLCATLLSACGGDVKKWGFGCQKLDK